MFNQSVKELFANTSHKVDVSKERAELHKFRVAKRETLKLGPLCWDIYGFSSKEEIINFYDIKIYKILFSIRSKLASSTPKISKILYWHMVNNKIQDLNLATHPILRDNIPYCQYMINKYINLKKENKGFVIKQIIEKPRSKKQTFYSDVYKTSMARFNRDHTSCNFNVLEMEEFPLQQEIDEEISEITRFRDLLSEQTRDLNKEISRSKKLANTSNILYGPRNVDPEPRPMPIDLMGRLRERLLAFRQNRLHANTPFSLYRRIIAVKDYFLAWLGFNIDEGHEEYYEMLSFVYPPHTIRNPIVDNCVEAYPEMDLDAHGEGTIGTNQASNVVLTEARQENVEVTSAFNFNSWTDFCSSELKHDYNKDVDRWMLIDHFQWTTTSLSGDKLADYILPYIIIKKEPITPCRMPNCIPFTFHRYWRGDIEIKIQINSNKFQIGSLQCSWLYSPHFDNSVSLRENLYSLSQAPHVIVNAASSNEATIMIPYKYYLPYLHTKPRNDMPSPPLNLGKLYIFVRNPLTVSADGPASADISVFARILNSEFTGMLAGDIDKIENIADPEMDMIADLGVNMLRQTFSDRNRDNPPAVGAPRFLVPTASHSWSVGTNLSEPIHPLRLDARGQTPHPPGIEQTSEMLTSNIASVYGLVSIIEWNKDHDNKKIIYDCDAAPMMESNMYSKTDPNKGDRLIRYRLPPVAVLSQLFYAWRGTLEYKFDIVSSQFHTGRIMVAYVPGVNRNRSVPITFGQLRASTNMVFTLQESNEFVFKVPFIANKPLWPRVSAGDYNLDDVPAPSRLYLAVVNKLIPMQSVSEKVYINMYIRAGDDFEYVIPVQPSCGLGRNDRFIVINDEKNIIMAKTGYEKYYSGSFEDYTYAQCFRWGTLSHEIAQFDGANKYDAGLYSYCKIHADDKKGVPMASNGTKLVSIEYVVFISDSTVGYNVGIPCLNEKSAISLAKNIFIDKKSLNDDSNKAFVFNKNWSTTSNTFCSPNIRWVVTSLSVLEDSDPEGERDGAQSVISVGSVSSLNGGMNLYGERFEDLKDLCRRYQLYGTKIVQSLAPKNQEYIQVRFPCLPQGLALDLGSKANINQIWNRGREGHIPIIADGFRFYRGSLRYRVIVDCKLDMLVSIQHRPDRYLEINSISIMDEVVTADSVINHTYSSYLQMTSVNGVIEFEVPFYQLGMYGLLQDPVMNKNEQTNYYGLGEICIGFHGNLNSLDKLKNCLVSIYYSIGDDMSFSTFQGFAPMILNSEIPSDKVGANPEMLEVEAEGLFDSIGGGITNIISDSMTTAVKRAVNEQIDKMGPIKEEIINGIKVKTSDSIVKIVLECMHLINSRSIGTICLIVINVLMELKLLVIDSIIGVVNALKTCVLRWISRSSSEVVTDESEVPNVDAEALLDGFQVEDWSAFVSMLFTGITAALSLKCAVPKNISSFSFHMVKTIPTCLKNFNFISSFITSIVKLISKISRYVIHIVYPVESMYYDLTSELPEVKNWIDEVLYLTGLDIEEKLDTDGYLTDRIYACVLFGRDLVYKYCESREINNTVLMRTYEKINTLYQKIQTMGKHPWVRKEPFCIWVQGREGIGKSFITEHLTAKMLQKQKIKYSGQKIYTVMPTNKHWTGCKAQPVLCLDDAFSVSLGETLENQLNTLYMVKSSCVLNPPMADLADKHLRYNPEIFYINSNHAFLNIAGGNFGAIHRRRDILIKAQMREADKTPADYNRNILKNFEHLEFFIAADVKDPQTSWEGPYDYDNMSKIVLDKYAKFYKDEYSNYRDRLATYDLREETDVTEDELRHSNTLKENMQTDYEKARAKYKLDVEKSLYGRVKGLCTNYDWWSMGGLLDNGLYNRVSDKLGRLLYTRSEELVLPQAPEVDGEMNMRETQSEYKVRPYNEDIRSVHSGPSRINLDERSMRSNVGDDDSFSECSDRIPYVDDDRRMIQLNPFFSDVTQDGLNSSKSFDFIVFITKALENRDMKLSKLDRSIMARWTDAVNMPGSRDLSDQELIYIHQYSLEFIDQHMNDKFFFYNKLYRICEVFQRAFTTHRRNTRCMHLDRPEKYEYNVERKMFELNGEMCVCHVEDCFLKVNFLNACFYEAWLASKPLQKLCLIKGKTDKLPLYFRKPETEAFRKEVDLFYGSFLNKAWLFIKGWKPVIYNFLIGMAMTAALSTLLAFVKFGWSAFLTWCGMGPIAQTALDVGIKGVSGGISCMNSNGLNWFSSPAVAEGAYAVPAKIIKSINPTAFAQMSSQQRNNIIRAITRNFVLIESKHKDGNTGQEIVTRARCLAIDSNRLLMIRHYHDCFLKKPLDTVFTMTRVSKIDGIERFGKSIEVQYLKLRTTSFSLPVGQTNFFILHMPVQVGLFKDIKHLFASASAHQMCGVQGDLVALGDATYSGLNFKYYSGVNIRGTDQIDPVSINHSYRYGVHKPGLCGAILLSDGLSNTPIIGMHVAGGGNFGYSEPLYQEFFSHLSPVDIKDVEQFESSDVDAEIELVTNVIIEGTVPREHSHKETGKTSIIPSRIQGVFPIETQPNPLHINDKRLLFRADPLKVGCEKHGLALKPFDDDDLEAASQDMLNLFINVVTPVRQEIGVLTEQQAICGDVDVPYFEKLEFSTSAGFGYADLKTKGNDKGKRFLFDLEDTDKGYVVRGKHERLCSIMEHKNILRKNGVVPLTIFTDCLKDTTLPIEKCKQPGKTRIFSISPVDFTIQFKQYFNDFIASYTKARFSAEHAIGINCDSSEWTELANVMTTHGDCIVAGDYSNFGPGLSLQVASAAFDIIINWYKYHGASYEHLSIMKVMKYEVLGSHHLARNLVYSVYAGIPSGSPITTPLNSIVNSLYIRLMWKKIFKNDIKNFTFESFREKVKIVTYGDDVLLNVASDVRESFNLFSLSDNFKQYGVTFTDARKGESLYPYCGLMECSFLSREFLPHPTRRGFWLPGLKKQSVQGCANWIKKKGDTATATLVNARMAVELSYGWGPKYYDEVYVKVAKACKEILGMSFAACSWKERDMMIFDLKEEVFIYVPQIDFC